ncbi:ABC transporter permease [Brevibacillus formosus]|uniref:ABC transporter permease n=1 Tax=Brevibacillus formosus TaxID=54913 RepID=UPI0018CF5036|nr:ABC transporter permease [Brevibacillus formosus]MBG9941023.1 hypothetical protein [Brevibacillus formosus]
MKSIFFFLTFRALYPIRDMKSYFIFRAIEPLLHYLFFLLIGMSILGKEYIKYIVLGNIFFLVAQTIIMNLIVMFRYERLHGTLILNVAAPTSIFRIVMTRIVIAVLDSFFVLIISFLYAYFLFGINVSNNLFLIFAFTIMIMFSVSGFALILASFGLILSNVNLVLNLALGVLLVFSGANFPIHLLPDFLEKIAMCLPMTNGLIGLRNIYMGDSFFNNSSYMISELSVGTAYLVISMFILGIMEKLSRKQSTLFRE